MKDDGGFKGENVCRFERVRQYCRVVWVVVSRLASGVTPSATRLRRLTANLFLFYYLNSNLSWNIRLLGQ